MLDTFVGIDKDLYIDGSLFVGSGDRYQDLCDVLYEACRKVYEESRFFYGNLAFNPDIGDQVVDLKDPAKWGARLTRPTAVMVNARWLTDGYRRGLWAWDRFDGNCGYPNWRTATAGAPVAASLNPERKLAFDVPFSASCVGNAGFYAQGYGCPNPFEWALDNELEWVVEPDLQLAVIYRACVDSRLWATSEAGEGGILENMRQESEAAVKKWRAESSSQQSPLQDTYSTARRDRAFF